MSRTYRNGSHKVFKESKKVKDGTRTRVSHFCECHGGCSYCEDNRLHQDKKERMKVQQQLKEYENGEDKD